MVRELLAGFRAEPLSDLPPFQGGAAGYIGYDYGACLERLPRPRFDDLGDPRCRPWPVRLGHRLGSPRRPCVACSPRGPRSATLVRARARARERVDTIGRRLRQPPRRVARPGTSSSPASTHARRVDAPRIFPALGWHDLWSSFSREDYLAAVARVREYIVAGDIFQANLSQRFEAPWAGDPWSLYRRLRAINPAPFAAYFETPGPRGGERITRAFHPRRMSTARSRRGRSRAPARAASVQSTTRTSDAPLAESEKDRAENLMIVDLLRNDLSRVCRARVGARARAVRARALFDRPSPRVDRGRRAGTRRRRDRPACARSFPGGSITGAPKVRAMEIIAELEPSRRGVYCGAVGYLSGTGAADRASSFAPTSSGMGARISRRGEESSPTPTRKPNIARRSTRRGR